MVAGCLQLDEIQAYHESLGSDAECWRLVAECCLCCIPNAGWRFTM